MVKSNHQTQTDTDILLERLDKDFKKEVVNLLLEKKLNIPEDIQVIIINYIIILNFYFYSQY